MLNLSFLILPQALLTLRSVNSSASKAQYLNILKAICIHIILKYISQNTHINQLRYTIRLKTNSFATDQQNDFNMFIINMSYIIFCRFPCFHHVFMKNRKNRVIVRSYYLIFYFCATKKYTRKAIQLIIMLDALATNITH